MHNELLKFSPYRQQFSPTSDKGFITEEQSYVGGTPSRTMAKVEEEEEVNEEENSDAKKGDKENGEERGN